MKTALNILVFLLAFLGLGAIFGGAALIISPSENLLGMPLSLLENSPFTGFFIPGIVLFSILGVFPLFVIFALIKKPRSRSAERINLLPDMHWAWTYTIYVSFLLIIWIQAEMIMLHAVHWSHSLYMLIGLAILLVALLPQIRSRFIRDFHE